jgi:hypothetical protein
MSLIISNLEETWGEMLSREVRKAAWNETSFWFAMIQPRSSRAESDFKKEK